MSVRRLALAVFFGGCASPPASPPTLSPPLVASVPDAEAPPRYPTAPEDTDAMILRRTACHGRCPIYSVGITSNGNVHFFGEMFTKKLGYAFKTIPPDEVSALYKFLADHPVSPVARKYPSAPDRAGAFVVLHQKGVVTRLDPPGPIITEIDRVAGTAEWVVSEQASGYDRGEPVPAGAVEAMLARQLAALDTCAKAKTEITLDLTMTELGTAEMTSAKGKSELDSDCMRKAVTSFRFPLLGAPVAPLKLTIGR